MLAWTGQVLELKFQTGRVRQGGILPRKHAERPPAWFSNALPGLGRRMSKAPRKNHYHCMYLGMLEVRVASVKGEGAENLSQLLALLRPLVVSVEGHTYLNQVGGGGSPETIPSLKGHTVARRLPC